MTLYTRRPGVYDIRKYTGDNLTEINDFLGSRLRGRDPDGAIRFWSVGTVAFLRVGEFVAKSPTLNCYKLTESDIAGGYDPVVRLN